MRVGPPEEVEGVLRHYRAAEFAEFIVGGWSRHVEHAGDRQSSSSTYRGRMAVLGNREFLAGGYLLTRLVKRNDEYMAAALLPEQIASVSSCLTDLALEYWWNDENVAEAGDFGVPNDLWPDLIGWYLNQFDSRLGAPGVGYSTRIIQEFVDRFVPDSNDLVILGCGLDAESASRLIRECRTPPERGEYGVFEMVDKHVPLEEGGIPLGFEVVSYEYGLEHSWLCNSLEPYVNEQFGIAPNGVGLLETFEEASRIADHVNREDVGAEPGLWLPWLVVQYPLVASRRTSEPTA